MTPRTYALILAGGAGTRFWPASRSARPKQLLPLTGGEPLLRETAQRVLSLVGGWEGVLVATGKHLVDATMKVVPEIPRENFFVEPVPRNTAPCIAWAAAAIARRDPEALLVVLPSDHHVDVARFVPTLEAAIATARRGVVTTIGIQPTHPETGFGYIEVGDPIDERARAGTRFVEKPSRAKAEEYLASGKFLWNAGMFIFKAGAMVHAFEKHLPAMKPLFDAVATNDVEKVFPTAPAISIDHGVMEKLEELAVVPGDFGWSDIGSWSSAHDLAKKDGDGNSGPESAVFVDARGNHVVDLRSAGAKKRVVAIVGASDLVVVETDDALLVVPRERSQDVRAIVDALKARGDGDLT